MRAKREKDEDMRRRQGNTSVCGVAMNGKPSEQGQPVSQTSLSKLGRPETWVGCNCGPMCAQKKAKNEMTGHEGGEDMKTKYEKGRKCVYRGKDERGTKWRGQKTTNPNLIKADLRPKRT